MLAEHQITALADVRSVPYSRRWPEYRREALQAGLERAGLAYVYLGRELGARREEPEAYLGDQVHFPQVAPLPAFRAGLARVRAGAHRYRIALLCAEREPLDCHRCLLISRYLKEDCTIQHLVGPGQPAEPHAVTEQRLLAMTGVARGLLDDERSDEDLLLEAYDRRSAEIAYCRPSG